MYIYIICQSACYVCPTTVHVRPKNATQNGPSSEAPGDSSNSGEPSEFQQAPTPGWLQVYYFCITMKSVINHPYAYTIYNIYIYDIIYIYSTLST